MRDLYSNLDAVQALASASRSAAATGATVDLQGVTCAMFLVNTGAISGDGDFGVTLQESDDGAEWANVAADQVRSDAPATLAANATYRLAYAGWQRFTRLSLTKAGGTSIQVGAVTIIAPAERPVA